MEKRNEQHTVIIPSYNTLGHLKNTYQSIKKYAPNVSMIIIDDASKDGTDVWLNSLNDENLTVIIGKERKGHTYWYDEGMRRAKTPMLVSVHASAERQQAVWPRMKDILRQVRLAMVGLFFCADEHEALLECNRP